MFNIASNNIYITDVKKNNKKSYLYLMNYSSEEETFEIRVRISKGVSAGSGHWKGSDGAMGLESEGATICLAWARTAFGRPRRTIIPVKTGAHTYSHRAVMLTREGARRRPPFLRKNLRASVSIFQGGLRPPAECDKNSQGNDCA